MKHTRKFFIALCLILVASASWLRVIDDGAQQFARQGLSRTLKTYAIVRMVSSTVSVLSSANIGVLRVGEALHPFNKLIDQFLDIMLLACASLALQLLLLKIGAHWIVSAGLTCLLLYVCFKVLKGQPLASTVAKYCIALLLLARFSVPIAIFATQSLYSFALEDQDAVALVNVGKIQSANPGREIESPDEEVSRRERIKEFLNVPAKVEKVVALAREAMHNFAHLIASYILQAIVLPLAFLWLFWFVARLVVSSAHSPATSLVEKSALVNASIPRRT